MYLEDITIRAGETLPNLAIAYGHTAADAQTIWDSSENMEVKARRGKFENIQAGDMVMIPIPWKFVNKVLTVRAATSALAAGGTLVARRNGGRGWRLSFVQTVNRGNQPIGPNPNRFCVDGCTPDDNLPFFWTNAELTAVPERRREFRDPSARNPPTVVQGTTRWRAVLSIAVVTGMRVTCYNSTVWGWDMTPAGVVTTVGPRDANSGEIAGHLHLLRTGVGTGAGTFASHGWKFREPPRLIGDFPMPLGDVFAA